MKKGEKLILGRNILLVEQKIRKKKILGCLMTGGSQCGRTLETRQRMSDTNQILSMDVLRGCIPF